MFVKPSGMVEAPIGDGRCCEAERERSRVGALGFDDFERVVTAVGPAPDRDVVFVDDIVLLDELLRCPDLISSLQRAQLTPDLGLEAQALAWRAAVVDGVDDVVELRIRGYVGAEAWRVVDFQNRLHRATIGRENIGYFLLRLKLGGYSIMTLRVSVMPEIGPISVYVTSGRWYFSSIS